MADVVVAGGSIAALVAADALAAAGAGVRLVLPERGVAGGFLPVTVDGRKLELGPRLVELSYDEEIGDPPPLADYRPGPHGHRPYLRLVNDFVRGLGGAVVDVRPPEIVRRGRRVADFLLLGDLITLPDLLDDTEREAVARETAAAVEREGPAGWLAPDREERLWQETFATASVAHHGPTFDAAFIDAIATKILPGGASSVVAALRRKIWLPLFHPSTLHDAVTGNLRYRPNRPAQTIEPGGMATLVSALLDRIRSAGVEVTTGPVPDADVLGGSVEDVFAAAAVEVALPRCRCVLAWVDVDEDAAGEPPSSLFVADPANPLYRVSASTAEKVDGRVTLTCELRHDIAVDDAGAAAVGALVDLGLAAAPSRCSVVHVAAVPAFVEPSFEAMAAYDAARRLFDERAGSTVVVGAAAGFAADSFNEQVVQGLAAADRLSAGRR